MTVYPELLPAGFQYDLGGLNVSSEETLIGAPVLFRHSLRQSNYRLTLTYTNLVESQATLIRDHYVDSNGSHRTFTLPTAIWGSTDVIPADGLYRYGAKPEETQRGVYTDMTVELVALIGNFLVYNLIGEPATLGAEADFTSYAMTGTAPFILDGDDAVPAVAATLILKAGGAES
jgi:hypothetical protein